MPQPKKRVVDTTTVTPTYDAFEFNDQLGGIGQSVSSTYITLKTTAPRGGLHGPRNKSNIFRDIMVQPFADEPVYFRVS